MNQDYQLSVKEALERPAFQGAYLAAGEAGLGRLVRWVHIIEVIRFDQLLQGGEMILTTGAAFKNDDAAFMAYLDQLVQSDAACLCIELGHHLSAIPDAWLEAAETVRLPVIIFPRSVRFIDITQDIHAHRINQHHLALRELEKTSRAFHRMTLTSQGVGQVLDLLHGSTKATVIYVPQDGQPKFVPPVSAQEAERWMDFLAGQLEGKPDDGPAGSPAVAERGGQSVVIQPVGAMGKTWAHLVLASDRKPQEYEFLILDSASLSIAQDLLRKRYVEERKLYSQTLWVDDLLHLRIRDEEQVKLLIGSEYKQLNELPYHAVVVAFDHGQGAAPGQEGDGAESAGIHLSLAVRAVFEQQTFHPLITLKNNRLVVIAFDKAPKSKKPAKERLRQVLEALQLPIAEAEAKLTIGIGQGGRGFMQAHVSYQEALQAISLAPILRANQVFFDEIGVFHLLFHIADKQLLSAFVRTYLGPILDHDEAKGSDLLRTLKVYLDCDGSKRLAAERLFIVRQSLYYRLDKIEELLGADYMQPEKRLALQVGIRAHQLLRPDVQV
ncbi:PucR family transcriptional regulator [Paenibacillus glycinis]|uniref:PucR family transcriptional regulator n=1 Tax=Paenibacillus glycinis TaxID=2697035 RepID=A0ABW9XN40_9BACL|nr:PucR family transcriptional regulator ligand-binding domain-containing protein [Paenibacillus glycinis]NBD23861.1 PucR family transcriptional regulator [Paenibacillus glycinis]